MIHRLGALQAATIQARTPEHLVWPERGRHTDLAAATILWDILVRRSHNPTHLILPNHDHLTNRGAKLRAVAP